MKKRLLIPVSMALLALAMIGGVASANAPAERGCLGETISFHAGPSWGDSTRYAASSHKADGASIWNVPGLAEEIAWIKAGNSILLTNSCISPSTLP